MAGSTSEDYGVAGGSSSVDGLSSLQHCQSVDSLAEWRSSDQLENGTPSTSPPYWDSDDDDDSGPKPSELYGKFTWNIENFSQISKRELRSNAFEVGGYKWYILIYPQGCDVCNHLSLFLCVANHDKLLPGWSHFAQFTISVVNKDPKKSKYSDTLHRFWKKEHDWGWKKFMELSKVLEGFISEDTLTIKAQVQVIREKAHRPFRCLDCQYRRELIRVYLSNVEQICRRFVEERRGKLSKLLEDKVKWSSFRAFWLGIDQNARRRMSREKADSILKVVVKHFFIEKEVTSTLVMDSLYSGLRALECQSKDSKGRVKLLEMEELPAPMVRIEQDMFVLADDVFLLLERAALEPLPHQPLPSKDDKGLQNRTKEGCSGDEFNRASSERDERRLTELGRRTVEIFVLAHIFSRIEVAYQEAVALKRQEELIREEEAAGQAENELKAKRGASEKEKKTKKKQTKQKRGNRKGKDRGRDEKSDAMMQGKQQQGSPSEESILEDFTPKQVQGKVDTLGDVSDVSDTGDDGAEMLQPDLEDRDASPLSWDTDTSEIHPVIEASNSEIQIEQMDKKSPSIMDDSSSTCSTDSVPSVVVNGPYKGNSSPKNKCQTSSNRVKDQRNKDMRNGSTHVGNNLPSDAPIDAGRLCDATGICKASRPEPEANVVSLKDRIEWLEHNLVKKEEEVVTLQNKLSFKDQVAVDTPPKSKTIEPPTSSTSPSKRPLSVKQSSQITTTITTSNTAEPVLTSERTSNSPIELEKSNSLSTRSPQIPSISKFDVQRHTNQSKSSTTHQAASMSKSSTTHQAASMSRPSSAPLIPASKPTAPTVSTTQTLPLLSRSASSISRLATEPSPSAQSFVPQSYRNAIMGKTTNGPSPAFFTSQPSLSTSSQTAAFSQMPPSSTTSSSYMMPPQTTPRNDQNSVEPRFIFGPVTPEASSSSSFDYHPHLNGTTRVANNCEAPPSVSSRQAQGVISDEFPHLDIINYLLDEDQIIGRAASIDDHHLDDLSFGRQYSFPRDAATSRARSSNGLFQYDQSEQYYDEGFQSVYGSSGVPYHMLRDSHPIQVDLLSAYGTSQWPLSTTADLSMLNLDGSAQDVNGYPYQFQDYPNLASCGVNGYSMMYRPANGL